MLKRSREPEENDTKNGEEYSEKEAKEEEEIDDGGGKEEEEKKKEEQKNDEFEEECGPAPATVLFGAMVAIMACHSRTGDTSQKRVKTVSDVIRPP